MKSNREQPIIIVKKKVNKHGHHGGAWKVALADFMTSMMALFLVLWLITQSSEVRSAIAGYFQDPLGRGDQFGSSVIPGEGQPMMPSRPTVQMQPADGRRDQLLQLSQQVRQAADSLSEGLGASHLVVEVLEDGLRISLLEDSTDVFFASGAPEPFPTLEPLFRAIGGLLASVPATIEIEGHTDAVPYRAGRDYGNWELSADRANAVRRLLVAGGLREQDVGAVRGLADRQPLEPEAPLAPRNRRVTILVTWRSDDAPETAGTPATPTVAAFTTTAGEAAR